MDKWIEHVLSLFDKGVGEYKRGAERMYIYRQIRECVNKKIIEG